MRLLLSLILPISPWVKEDEGKKCLLGQGGPQDNMGIQYPLELGLCTKVGCAEGRGAESMKVEG